MVIALSLVNTDPKVIVPADQPVSQVKLDLACGQTKPEGFTGVDCVQIQKDGKDIVDVVHDLTKSPWPFESDSIDEARCSHFFEHLDGKERIAFMSELWRILKPQAGCLFTTPLGYDRQCQDPTHKWPPIVPASYLYFDRKWLEANGLSHYTRLHAIDCDFEIRMQGATLDPQFSTRNDEFKMWVSRFYTNANIDLTVLVVKRP